MSGGISEVGLWQFKGKYDGIQKKVKVWRGRHHHPIHTPIPPAFGLHPGSNGISMRL